MTMIIIFLFSFLRLGEIMCAADALSKLDVRYDPDASDK